MSGWQPAKLGTAVTLVMGQAPAASECNKEGRGTPFVKVGEFGAERPVIREWTTDPKKFARATDVLICVVGATCGKINLGIDCAIGRSAAAIRPKPEKLDQLFLWYFMQGKVLDMRAGSQGAAQTVISREMINDIDIPLPPLDEQRRIVAVLDEAFAAIATATANAEKNLANAQELLTTEAQAIFANPRGDWVTRSLGSICELYQPQTIGRKDMVQDGQYTVFGANGPIGRYDKFNHEEPQLLVTCRGATCGSVNMSEPFSWITGNAMVVRPRVGTISVGLLRSIFQHAFDFSKVITGAAQPQITRQSLAPSTLVFPPKLEDQMQLEERLDTLSDLVNALIDCYEEKLEALAHLKQSLLQRAFAGNLTHDTPNHALA